MNLYLVSRVTKIDYDEFCAHVICACDESHAKEIAAADPCPEGAAAWAGAQVELLASNVLSEDSYTVLSSFCAG